MKRKIHTSAARTLVGLIAVVAITTSCNKDDFEPTQDGQEQGHKMIITATKDDAKSSPDTKVSIADRTFTWVEGDIISIYATSAYGDSDHYNGVPFLISGGFGTNKGTFMAQDNQANLTATDEYVYAIPQYATMVDGTIKVDIGKRQYQVHKDKEVTVDPKAISLFINLFGKSTEKVTTTFDTTTDVSIKMEHLTAILDFNLTGIPNNTTINSLTLNANSMIFPETIAITLGDDNPRSNSLVGHSQNVELHSDGGNTPGLDVGLNTALTIRLAMFPTKVPTDGALHIILNTTTGDLTTDMIVTKMFSSGKQYEAGKVYDAGLNYGDFKTPVTEYDITLGAGTNFEKELAGKHTKSITTLNIQGGELTVNDWDYMKIYVSELENLDISGTTTTGIPTRQFSATSLSQITLPTDGTLVTIGERAFQFCEKLTAITLPASITTIESNAFGNSGLMTITSMNPTPPTISISNVFPMPESMKILVPTGSVDAYKEKWSDYSSKIEAIQ